MAGRKILNLVTGVRFPLPIPKFFEIYAGVVQRSAREVFNLVTRVRFPASVPVVKKWVQAPYPL